MELIEKNNLENHLEFNETVLMNLKNAEHVVYVNEIITKNQSTLFILEEW